MIASWPGPDPAIHVYRAPPSVDARIKSGHDDNITIIASWPGSDPAIHVLRLSEEVVALPFFGNFLLPGAGVSLRCFTVRAPEAGGGTEP